ncbi:hypothetical protein H4R20_001546 [Coemansia guatemalensis]|uniref:Ribosomal protein S2 n=1 Tax=Coemansia guatemalensis TaxID=2761395 RepID=A0A9W8LUG0_9FUNG|nr:hypothetical protein H4R20_001546 [Coemansia guatemalensis]
MWAVTQQIQAIAPAVPIARRAIVHNSLRSMSTGLTPDKELAEVLNLRRADMRRRLQSLEPKFRAVGSRLVGEPKRKMTMDNTSANLTLESMMAAGMHLGHSASIWNPLNLPFIFGERQGIHIINLEHTMAALRRAAAFVRSVAYNGGIIVFAGKRKAHAQLAIDAALLSDQYFVAGRWTPGTLTNTRKLFNKHYTYVKAVWDVPEVSEYLEGADTSGSNSQYEGGRYMKALDAEKSAMQAKKEQKMFKPDLVIVLSPLDSKTMLLETRISHVPTVGVVDTNCDPRLVTYPIPCNDDSLRGMRIVTGVLARAARDGMDLRKERIIGAVEGYEQSLLEKEEARKAFPLSPELLR